MRGRILLVNYYYPPINNGGVQRTYCFKKYLSKMGFDVSFITTSSFGILEDDYDNKIFRFPDKGYDYTNSPNSSRIGIFFFRAFRLMLVKMGLITDGKFFWKKEVIKGIDSVMCDNYDVVIASYPTPANLEIGELIRKKYGTSLVIDYRDGIMYEPFKEVKNSFFIYKWRLKSLEKRMAKTADLLITVNPEMERYYSLHYPDVKTIMIPNGYDDEVVIDCKPIDLPNGINVLYTGSIGKSRKMYKDEELESVLGFIFDYAPDINFVFVGDYSEKEKILFHKYRNVYTHEKTDHNIVLATQKSADALLLISGPQAVTSGKMYEYLFSGRPILNIGGNKGIASIIDGQHFGITCAPEEHDKISRFIDKLRYGMLNFEKGKLENYKRRFQSETLAVELDEIISRGQ